MEPDFGHVVKYTYSLPDKHKPWTFLGIIRHNLNEEKQLKRFEKKVFKILDKECTETDFKHLRLKIKYFDFYYSYEAEEYRNLTLGTSHVHISEALDKAGVSTCDYVFDCDSSKKYYFEKLFKEFWF